jgi:hypothetical protein
MYYEMIAACHLLNVHGVSNARLEILTVVLLKNQVFWDAKCLPAPYSPDTVSHPRRLESSGVNDSRQNAIPSRRSHYHSNIKVQWEVISILSGGEEGLYLIKM